MIYITGDTHIPHDIRKFNRKSFPEQKALTASDYVIICGDFGAVWDLGKEDLHWIKWLNEEKNFTTLFVDGNHDNHDLLNSAFEVVDFCGGKAHKIADTVYHLMRGEVFTIEGKTFFTMGGAESHDKKHRTEGKSWWASELPSQEEYAHAERTLAHYNYTIDYVVSHCTATSMQDKITTLKRQITPKEAHDYPTNQLTDYFEALRNKMTYQKWYFGHYHIDREMTEKDIVIYNNITLL